MHDVILPDPIQLTNPETGEPIRDEKGVLLPPITTHVFVTRYVLASPQIGKGSKAVKRIKRLRTYFRDLPGKAVVTMDSDDVELLKKICEDGDMPTLPWQLSAEFEPFFTMWSEAKETPRKTEEKKES